MPLSEHEDLRTRIEALDPSLARQSFGEGFETGGRFIARAQAEPDQVLNARFDRKRAAPAPATITKSFAVANPCARTLRIGFKGGFGFYFRHYLQS